MSDDGHTIWPTSSLAESETLPEVNADQLALDDIPDYPAPLKPIAFQGPLGAHVLLVKPHTEADPAAVLLQDLVFFGNVINSSSFLGLGRIKATPNINLAIVGPTSTGRKGTSGAEARRLFANVDADWEKNRIKTGSSSGEGIVEQVCDAQYKTEEKWKDGALVEKEKILVKEAAQDKRLVVFETEFSRPLRVATREGSTLTAVFRQAFDGDRLCVMTKRETVASDVHISVVGHITKEELQRVLTETDMTNGFANRFLWACSRRPHLLPRGGELQDGDDRFAGVIRELCESARLARTGGELHFSQEALCLWDLAYADLTADRSGLVGSVLSRASTLVMRVALIYALSTGSCEVGLGHLQAALEVWRYCEASAKFIFGDRTGDPIADSIMAELRKTPEGLSRTNISDLFAGNKPKAAIEFALRTLAASGAIQRISISTGKGRPVERWIAAGQLQTQGPVQ